MFCHAALLRTCPVCFITGERRGDLRRSFGLIGCPGFLCPLHFHNPVALNPKFSSAHKVTEGGFELGVAMLDGSHHVERRVQKETRFVAHAAAAP